MLAFVYLKERIERKFSFLFSLGFSIDCVEYEEEEE